MTWLTKPEKVVAGKISDLLATTAATTAHGSCFYRWRRRNVITREFITEHVLLKWSCYKCTKQVQAICCDVRFCLHCSLIYMSPFLGAGFGTMRDFPQVVRGSTSLFSRLFCINQLQLFITRTVIDGTKIWKKKWIFQEFFFFLGYCKGVWGFCAVGSGRDLSLPLNQGLVNWFSD